MNVLASKVVLVALAVCSYHWVLRCEDYRFFFSLEAVRVELCLDELDDDLAEI